MAGAGAVVARILTQYSDKGSKAAQKDIARLEKKINAFSKKAVQSFAVAGAASAAYAVKLGVDSVKAATEDAKSQALLANSLKNVAGATDATIATVEKYISKQQLASNVTDTELRLSLSKLATATGDVTTAMDLQSVALDVSAGTTKDLSAVSDALSKAANGNFTALSKLVPSLDKNIVKNKDLGAALIALDKAYGGAAKTAAKADPFKRLQIIFGELSETIGFALLPAATEFASYIESDIIPLVEAWADANKDKLDDSLRGVMGNIKDLVDALRDIYKVLEGVNAILPFGIGGWLKLAVAVSAFSTASGLALAAMKRYKALKTMAGLARGSTTTFAALRTEMSFVRSVGVKVFQVFGSIGAWAAKSTGFIALITRGFIALSRAILMTPWGRIAALVVGIGYGIKKLADHFGWFGQGSKKLSANAQKVADSIAAADKSTTSMDDALNKYKGTQQSTNKLTQEQIDRNKRLAAITARNTAADKAASAEAAKVAKAKAAILKLSGLNVGTEDDPIQLEAARLNLVKQGNLAEAERIKKMAENLDVQKEVNLALQKYNDLLAALADNKVSDEEVLLLSKKWDMSVDAVKSYILTLFAVKDNVVSDQEVADLANAWGVTKDQAAKYLDFFNALNDGKLSTTEIANLQTKWNLTSKEVYQYADFVTKLKDYKLDDTEVKNLMSKWGLTKDEVVAYILKIGQPVTYSGTLIDPATAAELGWKKATAALDEYLKKLGATGGSTGSSTPSSGGYTNPGNIDTVNDVVASKQKELIDAIKSGTTTANTPTPSQIANEMASSLLADKAATEALGGTAGVLSSARYTGQALQYQAQQAAAQRTADTAAALRQLTGGGTLTDVQKGLLGMSTVTSSTLSNAASITPTSGSGSTNVTVNVQGSVTSEGDLVASIRKGLLAGQTNGNYLSLATL